MLSLQKTSIALLEQSGETIRNFWTSAGSPGKDPFRWAEEACAKGTVEDKSSIGKYIFGGFSRCLTAVTKFQTDTERRFAVILDRDAIKWFRPSLDQFLIFYETGPDQARYQPDFVAETTDYVYMIETKAAKDMKDPVVLAKSGAAAKWCELATEHAASYKGKPWVYLLIPHDSIADNMTLQGFAKSFSVLAAD